MSFTYSYSLFKHLKCIQFHHLCTQSLLSSSDNLFRRITPDLGSLFPPLPPHSGHSHSDTTTKQGSLEPIHCHYFHFCIISLVNILYFVLLLFAHNHKFTTQTSRAVVRRRLASSSTGPGELLLLLLLLQVSERGQILTQP